MNYSKPLNVFILAVIATFLWGCAPSFIKIGYELLSIESTQTSNILLFAGYRFTLAGILVILIQSILKKKIIIPQKNDMKPILVLAFFQTFGQYLFYYIGLSKTSGVNAAIITGTGALITLLFSVYIFKSEILTRNKFLGCLIGFIGIICINFTKSVNVSLTGDGLVLCSQFCYSLSACFIHRFSKEHDSVLLSGYQFLTGGIALILIALIMGASLSFTGVKIYFVLLYLGIISAVAYTLWGILLSYNSVSRIGIYGCLTPSFGVLISALLLQEFQQAFSFQSIVALLLIVAGLYLLNKEERIK